MFRLGFMKRLEISVLFFGLLILLFPQPSVAKPKQILSLTKALKKIQKPKIFEVYPHEINLEIAQRIVIYGEGFTQNSKVFVSRKLCQNLVFLNEMKLQCDYVPSSSKDNLKSDGILVVNPLNRISNPHVEPQLFVRIKKIGGLKLTPEEGYSTGGTRIYIEGKGFYPEMRVIFGKRRPCLHIEVISMEKLQCIAPPHIGGSQIQEVLLQYPSGAYAESSWKYRIPERKIDKIHKRRFDAKKFAQELASQAGFTLDDNHSQKWKNHMRDREAMRNRSIYCLSEKKHWQNSESIMRTKFTIQYLRAINRLEQRYPDAATQANTTISQVYQFVESYPTFPTDRLKSLKKEAALRFLDRALTFFRDDVSFRYQYPMHSNQDFCLLKLNIFQIISLAWEAIHDREIFKTQFDQEDREWGFIDSLATIQRAHNSERNTDAFDLEESDDPSCSGGIYKRLIEHLDGIHPDVQFYPELFSHNYNEGKIEIPDQMIALEIQQQHSRLWSDLDERHRERIRESYLNHSQDSEEYIKQLKARVVSSAPKIPLNQLHHMMNDVFIFSLLEVEN